MKSRKLHGTNLEGAKQDKVRLSSEASKATRHEQKIHPDNRTGRENAKDCHKTDNMSPKVGGKTKRTRSKRKGPEEQTCGKCGMKGHKLSEGCPLPKKEAEIHWTGERLQTKLARLVDLGTVECVCRNYYKTQLITRITRINTMCATSVKLVVFVATSPLVS